MNIAICFLTNTKNKNKEFASYILNKLQSNIISSSVDSKIFKQYDLYTLLNVSEYEFVNSNNHHLIPFTFNALRNIYNIHTFGRKKEYVGVCHLPLFYLYQLHPEYDYYIFYEDDLYYTGFDNEIIKDNPFNKIPFEMYDIIFTYPRKNNPTWFWSNKYRYTLPTNWEPYEGLLNCYIISNNALKDLIDFCKDDKYVGHHELLINSFFYNQCDKYKISTIDEYIPTVIYWKAKESVSVMQNDGLPSKQCFIHPVKNYDMLNYIHTIKPL